MKKRYPGNAVNLIANICKRHSVKKTQLEAVQKITSHLTSDDGVLVEMELYDGNICRFLIKGTRSSVTITYNMLTWDLARKPINAKPWYTNWMHTHASDILERVEELE